MKRLVYFFFASILITACQEKVFTSDVNCDECYSIKPDSADLIVSLSFNNENDSIPIVIYRDVVDENNIDYIDTAYKSDDNKYYLYSKVNQKYVVKAEYRKDDKIIFAVDEAKIKIKKVNDECDETCWVIEGGEMDVRLKF